jgi:hypothetical protein
VRVGGVEVKSGEGVGGYRRRDNKSPVGGGKKRHPRGCATKDASGGGADGGMRAWLDQYVSATAVNPSGPGGGIACNQAGERWWRSELFHFDRRPSLVSLLTNQPRCTIWITHHQIPDLAIS